MYGSSYEGMHTVIIHMHMHMRCLSISNIASRHNGALLYVKARTWAACRMESDDLPHTKQAYWIAERCERKSTCVPHEPDVKQFSKCATLELVEVRSDFKLCLLTTWFSQHLHTSRHPLLSCHGLFVPLCCLRHIETVYAVSCGMARALRNIKSQRSCVSQYAVDM